MELLPPDDPPIVPGSPPLVVSTRDDVLSVLPSRYKQALSATVRDALADSLLALLKQCQYQGGYAAAQRDVGRASGEYLDGQVEDRDAARAQGELDDPLRSRVLNQSGGVTFDNIAAAINAILAPFTSVKCQILDGVLDRWFLGGSSARNWHSFLERTANYPTRLYQHDAPQTGGVFKLGADPGGARLFNGQVGRLFYVRVPDLTGLNSSAVYVYGQSPNPAQVRKQGWYLGGGSSPVNTTFISGGATALSVYTAIKNTVQTLIGHSIRWVMVSDPKLV